MLETLDYTIRNGSTPTFLYLDLYLYSAYAAHYVYLNIETFVCLLISAHSHCIHFFYNFSILTYT